LNDLTHFKDITVSGSSVDFSPNPSFMHHEFSFNLKRRIFCSCIEVMLLPLSFREVVTTLMSNVLGHELQDSSPARSTTALVLLLLHLPQQFLEESVRLTFSSLETLFHNLDAHRQFVLDDLSFIDIDVLQRNARSSLFSRALVFLNNCLYFDAARMDVLHRLLELMVQAAENFPSGYLGLSRIVFWARCLSSSLITFSNDLTSKKFVQFFLNQLMKTCNLYQVDIDCSAEDLSLLKLDEVILVMRKWKSCIDEKTQVSWERQVCSTNLPTCWRKMLLF